jgi:hypothetical protein
MSEDTVVHWSNWDPKNIRFLTNGKKIIIKSDLVQTSKGSILYDISDTNMCIAIPEAFREKIQILEEEIQSYVVTMNIKTPYKSPLTNNGIRLSYNSETDMFDLANKPINHVAKETYVRTILRFKLTVGRTSHSLKPEIVQLRIAPEPKPESWMGD